MAEFMQATYPAFSRRARQVCILSGALEKFALGEQDAQAVARAALAQADAFGWNARAAAPPVVPAAQEPSWWTT